VSVSSPDFSTRPVPPMLLMKSPPVFSISAALSVTSPVPIHAQDGSGYQFLVEMLTDLNSRNPQVASRLIEPLIRLKRYDDKRQEKMRAALEQLKGLENLSGDLYEKITKALA
ncbi:aminopeptidase N C-terminal domain-containing protein, partial [Salmonella enterica subsp. enterica serovar Kentucky]|nr:aminopeptidase N C-terminal domain-containing protein [Salmonella enterica subsp. enterica serovar Kentucky]